MPDCFLLEMFVVLFFFRFFVVVPYFFSIENWQPQQEVTQSLLELKAFKLLSNFKETLKLFWFKIELLIYF